jgi:hypothetical protein
MDMPAETPVGFGPDWVVAEMPPGYRTRVAEIQRLTAELESMSRFSRLLCDTGAQLADRTRELFASLKLDTERVPGHGTAVVVRVDGKGRLLLHVSSETHTLQKRSPEFAHVFQMLHEMAEELDHVVLVTNTDPTLPPAQRPGALSEDALAFLTRMGASHVTAATLFDLWKLSLQEPARAREQVQRLLAHAGGTFEMPASLLV